MTYFVGLKKIRILLQSAKKWKMMSSSLAPASFVAKNREFYPFFRNASTLVYATAIVVVNGSEFCTLHKNKFKRFQSKQFYHFPIVQKKQVASTCSHSIIQLRNCSIK